ncbi:N-acetylmuramic acid 6-phosphate etherase [Georgenia faecalis]|uniref:N-acetylmuramic acid 6-phosphate etherase n=1 Tax=Georgenia faecalis TaxID=2483799 RepID=UPI000FD988BA|nr:N-acetylmuramic acid 6-phosphate etherase [Georgenia faecalis]
MMSAPSDHRYGVVVDSPTEERNERTVHMDTVPTLELLRLINAEDRLVPDAVASVLPELSRLVDGAAERVRAGGAIHYVGAGTSGRIGVIDAAELLPTFNLEPGVVVAHHAGGEAALVRAAENVEDDAEAGAADVAEVTAGDVVIGIAASGRTPFVAGALAHARKVGALTALVTSNPRSALREGVDVEIILDTGPEALAGSTRMKSATAQKLVLHTFSTALMVRLGRTWSNLMVSMVATNAKLRARTVTILHQATGRSREECESTLDLADGDLKVALVMLLADVDACAAGEALARADGVVRVAVDVATPTPASPAPSPEGTH